LQLLPTKNGDAFAMFTQSQMVPDAIVPSAVRLENIMMKQESFSVSDVCKATGLGRTSVFELIKRGKLRAIKAGRRTLIRHDDLMSYLDTLPPAGTQRAA
jgi:excisionase family DNA binding protein